MPDDPRRMDDMGTRFGGGGEGAGSFGDLATRAPGGGAGAEAMREVQELVAALPDTGSRYEIEGAIGEGGMGAVFRVRDRALGRKVALKRLGGAARAHAAGLARFLKEAQAVAALSHPNIVTIYELGRDAEGPFIAMELVDGPDLATLVRTRGPMPVAEAAAILAGVAEALVYAHQTGIVHRDVKPQNILMDSRGAPRLCDFGLARDGGAGLDLSRTGAGMGTHAYMAPEQITDAKHVDARADLYALGKTLYHLLTGELPIAVHLELAPATARRASWRSLFRRRGRGRSRSRRSRSSFERRGARRRGSRCSASTTIRSGSTWNIRRARAPARGSREGSGSTSATPTGSTSPRCSTSGEPRLKGARPGPSGGRSRSPARRAGRKRSASSSPPRAPSRSPGRSGSARPAPGRAPRRPSTASTSTAAGAGSSSSRGGRRSASAGRSRRSGFRGTTWSSAFSPAGARNSTGSAGSAVSPSPPSTAGSRSSRTVSRSSIEAPPGPPSTAGASNRAGRPACPMSSASSSAARSSWKGRSPAGPPLLALEAGADTRFPRGAATAPDAALPGPVDALGLRRTANMTGDEYLVVFRGAAVGSSAAAPLRVAHPAVAPVHARILAHRGSLLIVGEGGPTSPSR